jgi:outer membrane scaffolding protein for murein synthesis (MipA/OmpV family)
MSGQFLRISLVARRLGVLVFLVWASAPRAALSQTPSPLQEWQYPGGIILDKLFEPNLPEWRVVLGAAAEVKPLYDGAKQYREEGGPVIDIRYRDIAFASVGEGLGVNVLRSDHYRAGISIDYDLGHLHGLGNIAPAPVVKVFGSYVISKEFPLVMRADVRQIVGGAVGLLGDLEAYLPLPGSSRAFVMFAGPSITFANRRYMQRAFGITIAQALASGYPVDNTHAGSNAVGVSFSATRYITNRWLINMDGSANRLLGSARESPITQNNVQRVLALSIAYRWQHRAHLSFKREIRHAVMMVHEVAHLPFRGTKIDRQDDDE